MIIQANQKSVAQMVRDFSGIDIDKPDDFYAGKMCKESNASPGKSSTASSPSPDKK
jgi:hypothetical protein